MKLFRIFPYYILPKTTLPIQIDYQKYKIIEKFVAINEYINLYHPIPETPSDEKLKLKSPTNL